jgi:hypothetical protein
MGSTTTVKVSTATRDRIKSAGMAMRLTADEVINSALEALERDRLWESWRSAAASSSPAARLSYVEDQKVYDGMLTDGLDPDA